MRLLLSLLAALALSGCAAASLEQRMATAHSTYEQIIVRTDVAANAKRLTIDDAQQFQIIANLARNQMEAAHQAEQAGDHATATAKLALASSLLLQLQAYLKGQT